MTIDSSGNVGIGTSSPITRAHITKTSLSGFVSRTSSTLTLENSADTELYLASSPTNSGQIRFGDTGGNFRGAINYDHSSDAFLHYTAGSERLRIDSSGKVGIGTSSPAEELDISADAPAMQLSSTNASGRNYGLQSTNDGGFSFYDGTAGLERMRIDSSGRVTMPYQPAFMASGGTFHSDGVTFQGVTVTVNNGSHFSTTTGKFTAPVAGLYTFTFDLTTNDTNAHFADIYKNGSLVGGHMLTYGVVYQEASNSVILSLAVGDYVTAGRRGSTYGVYNAHFSGHLIG